MRTLSEGTVDTENIRRLLRGLVLGDGLQLTFGIWSNFTVSGFQN